MDMWLPIGSVVLLEGAEGLLMIYGRAQASLDGSAEIWDYVGCPYPEGNISEEYSFLFNKDQIANVFFIGFQAPEEMQLSKRLDSLIEEEMKTRAADVENGSSEVEADVAA